MRDAVLAIVGTIGIAALVMSMNKEKNQVREDFNGFSLRNRLDKTVKNSKNSEYVHAIPVDKDPLVKCGPNSNSKPKSVEHFSNSKVTGNGLGANTVTNMPYITPTPHYNQSVNQPSPSLNLPAVIRYNSPSLSNMGITENFQAQPHQVRENYENSSQCGRPTSSYMSPVSEYVGSNYTATPLPAGEAVLNH